LIADVARVNENLQNMLQALHLRASTTDDQQLQLFLVLYFSTILYGLIFSNLIFRPRIVLTLKNGDTVEAPFLFVRPRKFANALRAGNKVSKRTRKSNLSVESRVNYLHVRTDRPVLPCRWHLGKHPR
jgi:hypothetical protein